MQIIVTKDLLQKYFDGNCTDEEAGAVEDYLAGEDTSLLDSIFNHHLQEAQITDPQVDAVFLQEKKKIFRLLTPVTPVRAVRWLAAASILLVAVLGGIRLWRPSPANVPPGQQLAAVEWLKVSNDDAASVKKVRLPDGSTIYLNVHASVVYDRNSFNVGRREMTLTGEAYFQVAHDPKRPFVIHAGNSITTVLGTSFNIDAYDSEDEVNVTLVEGKVNVRSGEWAYDMMPNQRVTIAQSVKSTIKSVDAIEYSKWIRNGELVFDHMPLRKAIKKLSAIYGVDIQIDRRVIEHQYFVKGTFARAQVEKVLSSLLFIHALKYKKQDGKYTITL